MSLAGALFGDCGSFLGDAGVDMNTVTAAVNAIDPMTIAAGNGLIGMATHLLDLADNAVQIAHDASGGALTIPGQTSRDRARTAIEDVGDLSGFVDPLPREIATMVREAFKRAIVEFNAVADAVSSLAQQRQQLYADLLDGIKGLPRAVGQAIGKTIGDVVGGAISGAASSTGGKVLLVLGALALAGVGYVVIVKPRRKA